MSDAIRDAKRAAYNAACQQWNDESYLDDISRTFEQAERAVIRTLLSRLLPEGEVGFWKLVEEEVRR